MKYSTLLPLVSIFVIGAYASHEWDASHTGCYNYFLSKKQCVWASKDHPCHSDGGPDGYTQSMKIQAFQHPLHTARSVTKRSIDSDADSSEDSATLARRYDTTDPTMAVAGGDGICGPYNTNTTMGVCLWSGEGWKENGKDQVGWIGGANSGNCRKQVYIQRKGKPETVQYANVLDGCGFNVQNPDDGCFQAWMTIDLFKKFNPTKEELDAYTMTDLFTWDFNNLKGDKPGNAPI